MYARSHLRKFRKSVQSLITSFLYNAQWQQYIIIRYSPVFACDESFLLDFASHVICLLSNVLIAQLQNSAYLPLINPFFPELIFYILCPLAMSNMLTPKIISYYRSHIHDAGMYLAVWRHKSLQNLNIRRPTIGNGAFVAPSATLVGKVEVGENANIWYGAVVRGEHDTLSHKDVLPQYKSYSVGFIASQPCLENGRRSLTSEPD